MADLALREVVLWGATGQAKVLRECLNAGGVEIIALFDNDPVLRSPFAGVPLYHGETGLRDWLAGRPEASATGFLIAIGGERGAQRLALQERLAAYGLTALVAVHPTAFVAADARLGAGSQILAQSAVCVEAVLGRACIVNTAATVDHECRLGDGVHVCPGARLAGLVVVDDFATIGTGAVVLPRVRIGRGAVIGAGAVVTRDVAAGATVAGNPARPLRTQS